MRHVQSSASPWTTPLPLTYSVFSLCSPLHKSITTRHRKVSGVYSELSQSSSTQNAVGGIPVVSKAIISAAWAWGRGAYEYWWDESLADSERSKWRKWWHLWSSRYMDVWASTCTHCILMCDWLTWNRHAKDFTDRTTTQGTLSKVYCGSSGPCYTVWF